MTVRSRLTSEYTGYDVHPVMTADILFFGSVSPAVNSKSYTGTKIQISVLVKTSSGATVAVRLSLSRGGGCTVFYHDDEKGHIIIGEAAVRLAAGDLG
jgi:hypothetical protein